MGTHGIFLDLRRYRLCNLLRYRIASGALCSVRFYIEIRLPNT